MLLLLFVFGLIFGSFLNVVSLRYKEDCKLFSLKQIGGRSHCPHCKKQLKWYELLPLFSFVIQRGRCRNCLHRLSLQYPIVELLSGLIFVSVWLNLNNIQSFFGFDFNNLYYLQFLIGFLWILVFLSLLLLSAIDFRLFIIPDQINLFLGFLGVVWISIVELFGKANFSNSFINHFAIIFGFQDNIWLNHLMATLISIFIFGGIIFFTRGKAMGGGDLKLAIALGLIFGWPDIVLIIAISFILGSIIGTYLIFRKKREMKDAVPFGPFLAMATLIVFLFGYNIMSFYFGILR